MSKKNPHTVLKNYAPMNFESVSIHDLCLAEVLYEEVHNRPRKGSECGYITAERVEAKVQEKEHELKETGKVTTTIPPGRVGTAEVYGQKAIILDKEIILPFEPTDRITSRH